MDIKNLIDIDAFTKGLQSVMGATGLIIPFVAVGMIKNSASSMTGGIPYGGVIVESITDIWKLYILTNKS